MYQSRYVDLAKQFEAQPQTLVNINNLDFDGNNGHSYGVKVVKLNLTKTASNTVRASCQTLGEYRIDDKKSEDDSDVVTFYNKNLRIIIEVACRNINIRREQASDPQANWLIDKVSSDEVSEFTGLGEKG